MFSDHTINAREAFSADPVEEVPSEPDSDDEQENLEPTGEEDYDAYS